MTTIRIKKRVRNQDWKSPVS